MNNELHVVILAAGKGSRMHSDLPKVLHRLSGTPLIMHVLKTARALNPEKIHVIYGSGGGQVCAALQDPKINLVEQKEQLGTGHAVMQALPFLPDSARVLILYGDAPLIKKETLSEFINQTSIADFSILIAKLPDPSGFGRIIRDCNGNITSIVEEKDADDLQKAIHEVNTGIMLASAHLLKNYLLRIKHQNVQNEYYLTDAISFAVDDGQKITGIAVKEWEEILGINDHFQLAQLERYNQMQIAKELMKQGLTLIDPMRFDLRGELTIGKDVCIDVNNVFEGENNIGDNTRIGSNCYFLNARIGRNVTIKQNCVIEGCIIENDCVVGPFARIRPGSHIKDGAHIGNFVEVKKSTIGFDSKINHLTYIGDTDIGKNVNVGAGTITCNYDGVNKYKTIIEDDVFIGSNTSLIAPVRICKGATIGAGSTIVADAPKEKLTLARAKQVTIENWKRCQDKVEISSNSQDEDRQ
jgi:bifunctional UDP-N-acetylglucosamine pyrophosphorylase/glucosamine-1-phosphate N-acetyltransferase